MFCFPIFVHVMMLFSHNHSLASLIDYTFYFLLLKNMKYKFRHTIFGKVMK